MRDSLALQEPERGAGRRELPSRSREDFVTVVTAVSVRVSDGPEPEPLETGCRRPWYAGLVLGDVDVDVGLSSQSCVLKH